MTAGPGDGATPGRPAALSIAGSDPSGGAGIQADLKTFFAFGVYGMAVLTSLTAQNTRGVSGVHEVPPEFVAAQLKAVFADVPVKAVKTGMLKSAGIVRAVAAALLDAPGRSLVPLVVDPVMVATSGDPLLDEDAVDALTTRLFPLAALVTPNREEAEVLAGFPVRDREDAGRAAAAIRSRGAAAVLVKGIFEGDRVVDLLAGADGTRAYERPRLPTGPTHGSGCTLSAAIAAGVAAGRPIPAAIEAAGDYTWRAIRDAYPVGGGAIPLNHHVPPPEARR